MVSEFKIISTVFQWLTSTKTQLYRSLLKAIGRVLLVTAVRGSPIPLLKTVSRISNWPFHASRKMQKTPSRSQKKASNHVSRKNAAAKSCFTKRYKYFSRFAKHTNTIITKMYGNILPEITEMCFSRYSCTWPSFGNFRLFSRRCLDLLWLG